MIWLEYEDSQYHRREKDSERRKAVSGKGARVKHGSTEETTRIDMCDLIDDGQCML
jgi:hypothetical protein